MYYNENTIIYFDGSFVKAVDAKYDLYSQSLHYGYAVFEGIRAYDTHNGVKLFKGKEHYERMQRSAELIGIPYPFDNNEIIDLTYELLEKNNIKDAYVRPLVNATPNMTLIKAKGSQLILSAWAWGAYLGDKLVRVMTSSICRPNSKAFKIEAKVSGHYVNSIMASQEAKDEGYDEALLLDHRGYVAEGPGANIFYQKGGKLFTPQLGNILPGITRATIIELCDELNIPVEEKLVLPGELKSADSAFFCGTAAEVIGLQSLDEYEFPREWKDSLGAVLQKAYKNKVLELDSKPSLTVA